MLALEGLRLGHIDALEPLQVALQVTCSRCGTPCALALSAMSLAEATAAMRAPVATAAAACAMCAQSMEVAVAPHLMHERSNVLAHVTPTGCTPADLLPCSFGAQCGSCGAAAALRAVQVRAGSAAHCCRPLAASRMLMRRERSVSHASARKQTQRMRAGGPAGKA